MAVWLYSKERHSQCRLVRQFQRKFLGKKKQLYFMVVELEKCLRQDDKKGLSGGQ